MLKSLNTFINFTKPATKASLQIIFNLENAQLKSFDNLLSTIFYLFSADSRQERVKVEMGKTEFMFKVHTSNKEKALLNIVNINN